MGFMAAAGAASKAKDEAGGGQKDNSMLEIPRNTMGNGLNPQGEYNFKEGQANPAWHVPLALPSYMKMSEDKNSWHPPMVLPGQQSPVHQLANMLKPASTQPEKSSLFFDIDPNKLVMANLFDDDTRLMMEKAMRGEA